jgi:hypothetical protein
MTEGVWTAAMAAEDPPRHAAQMTSDGVFSTSVLPCRPLLLRRLVAAELLGMSIDSFERYVESQIKVLIVGRMRLVPYVELERYVAERAVHIGGTL